MGFSLQLDPQGCPHVSYVLSWRRSGGSSDPTIHTFDLMYAGPAAVLGAAGL